MTGHPLCACGHKPILHRYIPADHANTGRCLVAGCPCIEAMEQRREAS